MRLPSRRGDDADLIRARLRTLLAEHTPTPGGWVPAAEPAPWADPDPDPDPDEAPGAGALDAPEVDAALPPGLGRHRAPGTAVRWDTGRPGAWALWVAAVLAVALLLGWTWLDRPTVEPAPAPAAAPSAPAAGPASPTVGEAAETSTAVVVSVVGQVARPGLITLSAGARVADAIEAAGGLLPGADPASINLAAPLSDGQQIAVGLPGVPGPAGSGAPAAGGSTVAAGGPVDLNAAGVADLDALPGIGPVLAQRIVDHRTRHGPYRSVDDLDDVPGIGPAIAAELAELVRV